MFCKSCGKEITDNVSFCPHCGAPFREGSSNNRVIVFYREKSSIAKLASAKIFIDGTPIGELKEKERCSVTVSTGSHSVEIKTSPLNPASIFSINVNESNPSPYIAFKIGLSSRAELIPQANGDIQDKTKKKDSFGIAILCILLFLLMIYVINLPNTPNNSKDASPAATSINTSSFKSVSSTVGTWEIKVNDFSYSQNVSVGLLHEYQANENSKYCIVSVTVKNVGSEASTFAPFFTYDGNASAKVLWNGLEYTCSNLAFSEDNLFSETLNPLVSTTGNFYFELPDEVIESEIPPTFIISDGTGTLSCELSK